MSNFKLKPETANDPTSRYDDDLLQGLYNAINTGRPQLALEYIYQILELLDEHYGSKQEAKSSKNDDKPAASRRSGKSVSESAESSADAS
jgi:hypothetical protein